MIVGPSHTFEQFAGAINVAFARWDLSHLHEFELADGRRIGFPDDEFGPELEWLDHAKLKVAREVGQGDEFEYGPPPAQPVAIWGWGSIPDQYGRRTFDGDDEEDEDAHLQ